MGQPSSRLARESVPARQVRFCATATGVRVAFATSGRGPALLVPAAWISHLELMWQDSEARAFFAPLAARRTVIEYDKPGCGLSDPWPGPQSLETDLEVLAAVADHLGLERFDLFGISLAAPVSIAFAAQHPERVGRLVLYGGYADGHEVADDDVRAAMIALVRAHWGLGSEVLSDVFLPDASAEAKAHFARLQRDAAPVDLACELLAQCYETRVDDLLESISVPTLVLHRRGDRAIPYRLGRELAARIPGARLKSLTDGATSPTRATRPPWSARSSSSSVMATSRAPAQPGHPRLPPCSRPGSSRSRPWWPTASPTARSPRAWGSRSAPPRDTWNGSASGWASPPVPRSPPGGRPRPVR